MFSLLTLATQIALTINAAQQENQFTAPAIGDPTIYKKVPLIRIPGDLLIGGVFPVHSKTSSSDGAADPCGAIAETRGVHRVEAMLYALDMINEQKELLRGFKLGAVIMDSCSNPAYALNQSLDFVRDLIGDTEVSEYQCRDGSTPIENKKPRNSVVAVVGGSYSSVTVQVANLLRLFRIVQVSPASTNADLSDKSRFEFFARTVPSDNYQVRAMISIAKQFNWTYVSLLYSADEYGELGAEAFKKEARKENICIATEERINIMKPESMRESIDNLSKKLQTDIYNLGSQVVVTFVNTDYVAPLMEESVKRMKMTGKMKQKKIIWLASEGWDRNNQMYTAGERWRAVDGAIVIMLASQRIPSFERYYRRLRPGTEKFERNDWLKELWQDKYKCQFGLAEGTDLRRCEDVSNRDEIFHADDKVQFTINAVYAIANALDSMYKHECQGEEAVESSWISRHSKKPELCQAMRKIDGTLFYQQFLLKVKFNDSAGVPFHFSENGDGPASYTILNYQPKKDANGNIVLEANRSDYVVIGQWNEGTLTIDHDKLAWGPNDYPKSVCSLECQINERKQMIKDEQCCWACVKCEDYEFLFNETTCMDCGVGMYPTDDRKGCYNISLRELKYIKWSSAYAIVPTITAIIGIIGTLFVIAIYINPRYNETPVVKASGRELSYVLLFAMMGCYLMTFVLVAKPSTFTCAMKRTGIGLAFSALYSAMLIKTNRIARIFSNVSMSRPSCISPVSQVGLTAALISFQFIYSVIWLIVTPPGTKHSYPTRREVVLTCNVPDHHFLYSLTYVAALLIACTFYAIKTRKVPENFNETKFIGFSTYTTCVLWVSWICFFFSSSDFQIQTSSLCISISMSANVALICIFSPKVWIILFEKHKNVRKPDGEYMLGKSSSATNQMNNNQSDVVL